MRHATLRALATLRGEVAAVFPENQWACGTLEPVATLEIGHFSMMDGHFSMMDAVDLIGGRDECFRPWPTCPRCLVLLDEALEQRRER